MTSIAQISDAYLILQSVRPKENRYRIYTINIEKAMVQDKIIYAITLSWGRVGLQMRSRAVICLDEQEVDKLLNTVIRTRYRHGYQIVEKSLSFPECSALTLLQMAEKVALKQLFLFP